MSEFTPARFVAAARAYLGTPWQHQGRTRFGIDCIGVPICAARDCGQVVAEVPDYIRMVAPGQLGKALAGHCGRVLIEEARPGDIVLCGEPHATHIGLLGDGPDGLTIIHAPRGGKCCIEVRFDVDVHKVRSIWRPKIFSSQPSAVSCQPKAES